jgi:hypothetical protein
MTRITRILAFPAAVRYASVDTGFWRPWRTDGEGGSGYADRPASFLPPADAKLSFSLLSLARLTLEGWGTARVLAMIALLGCSGFEQTRPLTVDCTFPSRFPAVSYDSAGEGGVFGKFS